MPAAPDPASRDTQQLDAFHRDLLPALARGLNVEGILQHMSTVAGRIVPHDEAHLILRSSDGSTRRHVHGTKTGEVTTETEQSDSLDSFTPGLVDMTNVDGEMRSGIRVAITCDDALAGGLTLYSSTANAYSDRDASYAQRIAGYFMLALSHQRVVDEARQSAIALDRTAQVDTSLELLRTIGDVLDIRSVFPRISEIVNRVLPHDALAMVFFDKEGHPVVEAKSTDDFPEWQAHRAPWPLPPIVIIQDLRSDPLKPISGKNPTDALLGAGFVSMLGVVTQARDQQMSIAFFGRRPAMFSDRDAPIARRVTDFIALAVSHHQLSEAQQQIAETRARAEQLEARVRVLAEELDTKTNVRMVGESEAWRAALKKATQVASTDTTVLLTGESGTGKEVIARFIHRASSRNRGAFVALNCAALPEQLLESELFGYERGAFTSAQQAKPGQIEMAGGGVLFLDEVSEMSLGAQAKFLRVLQEREFQRLGGTRVLKANIRVIAATNRDLRKAVERGQFREDLFYRLQVFDIQMAPLRERRDDIVAMSTVFLDDIGKSFGRAPAGLAREAKDALLAYDWPGNVRELRNALERAAILADGGLINVEHLSLQGRIRPRASDAVAPPSDSQTTTDLGTMERDTIARVMREVNGNKVRAAKQLGLSRTQLYVRLRKYGLSS